MKYFVKAKRRQYFSGFWRDGRFWPDTGIEVDESEITDAVLNEAMLIVSVVGEAEVVGDAVIKLAGKLEPMPTRGRPRKQG